MAKRETYGKKLDWIVKVIAVAAVVIVALASAYNDGTLKTLRDTIAGELLADLPTSASAPTSGSGESGLVRVHFIDVGQGESILIEAPEKNVLIDAGENNKGETVLRYLEKRKIDKIDVAIGTHPHSDHIGGMDIVILAKPVDRVILPFISEELSPTTPTYMDMLNAISSKNLKITPARPGDKYDLGGGATLELLGPVRNDYADLNDFSIVSRLDYGSDSFLFTGDATEVAEKDLTDSGALLRANVFNVGHHGSRSSNSKVFLEAVSPVIAAISCGIDNSYGHPHRQAIQRIEKLGDVKILRTDLDGSVILTSDGKNIKYETEK